MDYVFFTVTIVYLVAAPNLALIFVVASMTTRPVELLTKKDKHT